MKHIMYAFVVAMIAIAAAVGLHTSNTAAKSTSSSSVGSTPVEARSAALESFVRTYAGKAADEPVTEFDVVHAFGFEAPRNKVPELLLHGKGDDIVRKYRTLDTDKMLALTEAPQQLHISMGSAAGSINVMWTTSEASKASQACYREPGAATFTCVNGTAFTYHPISVIPWKGMLHLVEINELIPGAKYEYRVQDPTLVGNSSVSEWVPFTAPNPNKDEVLVAVGGDMGSIQLFGHYVAKQMRDDEVKHQLEYDAFWLVGDIAYSTLDPPKANFEFFWDMFMQQEESFANHVPFHVTYGNHDFSGGDSGAFIKRFRNPQNYNGNGNFYWAHRLGPILYVSMCTEWGLNPSVCNYGPGSAQYQWLERTFASINRTETPWLVLAGHRPMYSSDKATDSGDLQKIIEPLILKYKVDLQIAGHMHDSEVMSPVANNSAKMAGVVSRGPVSWTFTDPEAPVHLTMGNMGAVIHESFVDPKPEWSLFRNGTLFDNAYGYTQLRANRTSLHFTSLRNIDGSVMWDLLIEKKA